MSTATHTTPAGPASPRSAAFKRAQQVAEIICTQIETPVLWSLGATNLSVAPADEAHEGGLAFAARILPFTKSGQRSTRPRIMHVTILLSYADYYDIRVTWYDSRRGAVTHFERDDVDAYSLNRLLLALDYDGDTALNPRYAH